MLLALWWILERTRFGMLTRAATENRVLAAALGVDERRLFTAVFAMGAFLAGARRRVAAAARAGQPRHGPRDHRRGLRRHRRRRTGIHPRRVRRRAADRAHQGAVHRHRHRRGRRNRDRLSQAHAGRRIRRDGDRPRRASVRADGHAPCGAADDAGRRIPRAGRTARKARGDRRARRARPRGAAARGPATSTGSFSRPTCSSWRSSRRASSC